MRVFSPLLLVGCLYLFFPVSYPAQERRPKGLRDTPSSSPLRPKKTQRTTFRTPTGVVVPLGKKAAFYLDKGKELLSQDDAVSARFVFEEGLKSAAREHSPQSVVENLNRGHQQALLFAKALDQEKQGRSTEAVATYTQLLALAPNFPPALRRAARQLTTLGEAAQRKGDWAAAVAAFDQARKLEPNSVPPSVLTSALIMWGDTTTDETTARTAYTQALHLDPENLTARKKLLGLDTDRLLRQAEQALADKQYTKAENLFGEALKLSPANAQAQRGQATATAHHQREEAETAYQNRDFRTAQNLFLKAATVLSEDPTTRSRTEELAIRLAAAPVQTGTFHLTTRTRTAFLLRLQDNQATIHFLTGDQTTQPTFSFSTPLPRLTYTPRIRRVSSNAHARITERPMFANHFTTTIQVEPEVEEAEDIQLDMGWTVNDKGHARWQAQIGPGKYQFRWQTQFLEVKPLTGPEPASVVFQQDPLPHRQVIIKPRTIEGTFTWQVISWPTPANEYTLILELEAEEPTLAVLGFTWTL